MQFYLADWCHTHTFTQKAKKRKVVTSQCASSLSPTIVVVVAPGPDSSGVVGEPSPAPLVRTRRSTTGRTVAPPVRVSTNRPRRATSAGTSEEEGSAFYTEVEPFWREHRETSWRQHTHLLLERAHRDLLETAHAPPGESTQRP